MVSWVANHQEAEGKEGLVTGAGFGAGDQQT